MLLTSGICSIQRSADAMSCLPRKCVAIAPADRMRTMKRIRPKRGVAEIPIWLKRSLMRRFTVVSMAERIKNVAHAGTRINRPAREYRHRVFTLLDPRARWPASPIVYQNRQKIGPGTAVLISVNRCFILLQETERT